MRATGFTHVSVHAYDLDESARFYMEVFGMEEILAPNFPFPVRWLRVGDLQLHLFESEEPAPSRHHFGIEVDDFEAAYEKANELGIVEGSGYFSNVYELPDGVVQLYARPCGQHGRGQLAGRHDPRPLRDRRHREGRSQSGRGHALPGTASVVAKRIRREGMHGCYRGRRAPKRVRTKRGHRP